MQLQKIFVVLGPPGSGKGTQSALLAEKLSFEQIVMGDLIREYIQGTSAEAKAAKDLYDKGIPQPDTVATMLLKNKLQTVKSQGAVFDTYPLSIIQAVALDEIAMILGIYDMRVVFLNVSKEEVVKRISQRKICSACKKISLPGLKGYDKDICWNCEGKLIVRTDDNPAIAAARYDEYETRNQPIKDFYLKKGILTEINGDQSVEQVQQEILRKLGFQL